MTALEDVWRRESPRVLGALMHRYGGPRVGLEECEDAAQEAALAAAAQWPASGVPDDPGAWLVRVASRRLVDRLRADTARSRRETFSESVPISDREDGLRLLLLCCHPALSRPSQVALTLRSVAGLTTEEVAAAYLVPARTMTQRLTRARATLRDAGAQFELPSAEELPPRVAAVLDVCHLVFNEGHTRTTGEVLVDVSLTAEAIRLARGLAAALPDHDEVAGALALMLLTSARSSSRSDEAGDLVTLADQDRSRWDAALIAEGVAILERVLPRGPVGRFQLQAAIAAVHAEAPSYDVTDWAQITVLYAMLDEVAPGPAVTLNRAVAIAMVQGPSAGIEHLAPLLSDSAMLRHHRTHAVHAHLLELAGDLEGAASSYREAARLTASIPEQRYLNARLRGLA